MGIVLNFGGVDQIFFSTFFSSQMSKVSDNTISARINKQDKSTQLGPRDFKLFSALCILKNSHGRYFVEALTW